ncbi:MAG: dienelactone hydrolase family protein [Caulobacteraceae bacterium]
MGEALRLTSQADGFDFDAYRVRPEEPRRGGLVLVQEIFGVNANIRSLADSYAAEGYDVIAPAMFDRLERGFETGYDDPADIAKGRDYAGRTDWALAISDVQACIDALSGEGRASPVFITGYCYGGSVAWVAACRAQGLTAASAFYGRLIVNFIDETPRCPIILHFGKHDATIPPEDVARIEAAHPDIPVWLYDAGHGFCCDARKDYQADAARLAKLRTLQLFHRSGGARGEMGG